MMENSNTQGTAFSFTMNIVKSVTQTLDDHSMRIRGVASGIGRDKQDERITVEGLQTIKKSIEQGIIDADGEWTEVPLRSGHRTEWDDVLGYVKKAEIDSENNLWIEAELDETSSTARDLYHKLEHGDRKGRKPKLGLSVRGKVNKYHYGIDREINKSIVHFDDISIAEISVTGKPVYTTPYYLTIAKSLDYGNDGTQGDITMENKENVETAAVVGNDTNSSDAVPETTQESEQANVVVEENAATAEGHEEAKVEDQKIVNAPDDAESKQEVVDQTAQAQALAPDATVKPQPVEQAYVAPFDHSDLQKSIEALTSVVSALQASHGVEQKPVEDAEAQKPVEANTEVQKSLGDPDVEKMVKDAVAAALAEQMATFTEAMTVMKSAIDEVASAPNDKSFSVSKAKDSEDENDPFVRMRKYEDSGDNSIVAALKASNIK